MRAMPYVSTKTALGCGLNAGQAVCRGVRYAQESTGDAMVACAGAARTASAARSSTCGRLYVYETLLQRLAQDFEDMAAEFRPFISKEHAVVRQRHLTRHRHLAAPDQPHIGHGMGGRGTAGW
jgi:hypothetical protein